MTTFDPSRVIPAFDALVQHMRAIELPPSHSFQNHVSEAVLPAFETLFQQYAAQHSNIQNCIAVLRRAWACLAPFVSESEIECAGGAISSKTSSFPQPEAVQEQSPSRAASRSPDGYGTQSFSALARDPALFHKLAEASISSLKRKDKRFMGEVFSRHVKPLGLSAKALASALHAIDRSKFPAQVSDADAECKLKEVDAGNKGHANFEEFCRAAKISSDPGAETDTSAARDVFLRFVKGLSAQSLVAALKEVDAPVLLSSEGCSPEQIFRRADVNMSGSVDFAELDPHPTPPPFPPPRSRHFSLSFSSLWFQVHACS